MTPSPPPSFPTIITTRRVVPNQQPLIEPGDSRIAIIGEAPGEDEECHGFPFVGRSGQFLDRVLSSVGIERRSCFVGNVCQVRPPANEISRFPWDGDDIQTGLHNLRTDLQRFAPNICVLLGGAALRAASDGAPNKKISDWRGSLFNSDSLDRLGRKCVASLHPAGIIRPGGYTGFPLLKFDLKRAYEESRSPLLQLPVRELLTSCDPGWLCYIMDNWPRGVRCALDIEGGLPLEMVNPQEVEKNRKRPVDERRQYGWPCVSICADPARSITLAWGRMSVDEHARALRSFARLMGRTDVPKVLQNSLYDNFVLSYGYRIPIRNVVEDTMLKGWEVYCELPKSLGTQASIWTREQFYKSDRKSGDFKTYLRYCAKDSAVTLEICNAQDSALAPHQYHHYRANVDMLNPLLFMELRGIKYDEEKVKTKLGEVKQELTVCAETLRGVAGGELRGEKGSLSATRLASCLYQRDTVKSGKGKKAEVVTWKNSPYPPQFKKEGGRNTDKLTTDIEAMLALGKKFPGDTFIANILRHRHLEGLVETLNIFPDPDGRVRCGYNVVGTETGRLSCYSSPTGAGANLQTITKTLRGNYTADPGYDFFQCDLEGADGWTVAAHCARLGDRTMLDDYYAGIKPAKVIGLLYYFGSVINELDRESLKHACDRIFPWVLKQVGKWLYLGCKRVQHGTNYLMGIPTMQKNVLIDSFKESGTPVYLEHSTALTLQQLYLSRYPGLRRWHQWAETMVLMEKNLVSASGQERIFFGRKSEWDSRSQNKKVCHDTLKEFLAHEPQSNTTWSTNLAMLRLWNDPANRVRDGQLLPYGRRLVVACDGSTHTIPQDAVPFMARLGSGSLLVEPLHTVHDALCGQWPQCLRDWARGKVKEWGQNEITIAGTTLVIPFDGQFGNSWGELEEKQGGQKL